jgi:hypothetical protein
MHGYIIIIIIIIITPNEFPRRGSSSYTSTEKINQNKFT